MLVMSPNIEKIGGYTVITLGTLLIASPFIFQLIEFFHERFKQWKK